MHQQAIIDCRHWTLRMPVCQRLSSAYSAVGSATAGRRQLARQTPCLSSSHLHLTLTPGAGRHPGVRVEKSSEQHHREFMEGDSTYTATNWNQFLFALHCTLLTETETRAFAIYLATASVAAQVTYLIYRNVQLQFNVGQTVVAVVQRQWSKAPKTIVLG